jgi:hypothetical protein
MSTVKHHPKRRTGAARFHFNPFHLESLRFGGGRECAGAEHRHHPVS